MSGIYVPMEMPRCCAECDAEGHYEDSYGYEYGFFCPFGYKAYTRETRELKRLDDCPLVPVPPHGRLVDADVLDDVLSTDTRALYEAFLVAMRRIVCVMPTIIPADKEGEG